MTTRPYSELLAQVQALAGVDDFAAAENARVKIFVNRRARKAYAESELWPRWLVAGEERIVSEEGLLPFAQSGLRDIGTIYRIHATEPFKTEAAGEYVDWNTQSDGIQITGYQAAESTGIEVTSANSILPTSPVLYLISTTESIAGRFNYYYAGNEDSSVYPYGVIGWDDGFSKWDLNFSSDENTSNAWSSSTDVSDPVAAGVFLDVDVPEDPTATLSNPYSAFITYKAALPTTYGDADGEESNVPEEWFEYMAQGAYADFLRSDGTAPERVIIEETIASELLEQQLAKISRQNGAHLQTRILSHGNMQNR